MLFCYFFLIFTLLNNKYIIFTVFLLKDLKKLVAKKSVLLLPLH